MNWSVKFESFWGYLQQESWRNLIFSGLLTTVEIAVLGLLIGIVIGSLIAVVKVAPQRNIPLKILKKICDFYIMLFRGTPMVVQLLLMYYVLMPVLGISGVPAIVVAIIVFGMNSGAYVAEIMRGGINSVDRGQMEAGRALGLSYSATMLKIVIPQAVKNILPTLGNEFITLIKETSIVSFITVVDLYTVMQQIGSNSYDFMVPYLFMAIIYIVLVLLITLLVRLLEKIFSKSDRYNHRGVTPKKRKIK